MASERGSELRTCSLHCEGAETRATARESCHLNVLSVSAIHLLDGPNRADQGPRIECLRVQARNKGDMTEPLRFGARSPIQERSCAILGYCELQRHGTKAAKGPGTAIVSMENIK